MLKRFARWILFKSEGGRRTPRQRPPIPRSRTQEGERYARIVGKPWGNAHDVHATDGVLVRAITVEGGGFCSRHLHRDKDNLFHVLSGELEVVLYSATDGHPTSWTTLHAGEQLWVPAGVQHRFRAYADCIAVEVYRPARAGAVLSDDDIVRLEQGGRQ